MRKTTRYKKIGVRFRRPGPTTELNAKLATTILSIMNNAELRIFRDAANVLLAQPDRKVRV